MRRGFFFLFNSAGPYFSIPFAIAFIFGPAKSRCKIKDAAIFSFNGAYFWAGAKIMPAAVVSLMAAENK